MAYRDHLITSMEQLQALYGAAGFVRILDDKTLAIPDRPGNNRIDSFRNIIELFSHSGRRRDAARERPRFDLD